MKLLRHLLSHIILILVLFGIVSIYYYRHHVLPDTYAEKIDTYTDKIHPKLKSFARVKKVNEDSPSIEVVVKEEVDVVESKIDEDKAIVEDNIEEIVSEQESGSTENAEVESSSDAANVAEIDVAEKDVAEIDPVDINVTDIDTKKSVVETVASIVNDKETEVPFSVVIEEIKETNGSPNSDKEAASGNDLLRAARLAFSHGDLKGSVAQYNLLIELENDEADFHGELGNVYYAMGHWKKAGLAYYEAATRLVEQRKLYQVHYLQRVIRGLDPERAEKLASQLASLRN